MLRSIAEFTGAIEVTEKIDGTNARIILPLGSAPLIGSRTELLHYLPEVIYNPAQGIVETLKTTAGHVAQVLVHGADEDHLLVLFGEVFGGKTSSGAKNYSAAGVTGFRLFGVAEIPVEMLGWRRDKVARWRDAGSQSFGSTTRLAATPRISRRCRC